MSVVLLRVRTMTCLRSWVLLCSEQCDPNVSQEPPSGFDRIIGRMREMWTHTETSSTCWLCQSCSACDARSDKSIRRDMNDGEIVTRMLSTKKSIKRLHSIQRNGLGGKKNGRGRGITTWRPPSHQVSQFFFFQPFTLLETFVQFFFSTLPALFSSPLHSDAWWIGTHGFSARWVMEITASVREKDNKCLIRSYFG